MVESGSVCSAAALSKGTLAARTKGICEVVAGTKSLRQAAAELGVSASWLGDLRQRFVAAGTAAIAPRAAGRPKADAVEAKPSQAPTPIDPTPAILRVCLRVLARRLGYEPPAEMVPPRADSNAADTDPITTALLLVEQAASASVAAASATTVEANLKHHAADQVRLQILDLARALRRSGDTLAAIAAAAGIPEPTLREWNRKASAGHLKPRRPGRRSTLVDQRTRQSICDTLKMLGPRVSVAELVRLFPALPRRFLHAMRQRMRAVWRKRQRVLAWHLTWTRPRTVWAIDGIDPPNAMAGGCAKALVARDLGSNRVLEIAAVSGEDAASVTTYLRRLFTRFGPPIALKADNGSGFKAMCVQELCREHGVIVLYSPPCSPWYQGQIETGMSAIRDAVDELSARLGRPGTWTQDDLDQATIELNLRPMLRRDHASPAELWRHAPPITASERADIYRRYQERACELHDDAVEERRTVRAILEETGLLCIEDRCIPRRQTKRGLVRHVAGRLAALAALLDIAYEELCARAREAHFAAERGLGVPYERTLDPRVTQIYNELRALQTA